MKVKKRKKNCFIHFISTKKASEKAIYSFILRYRKLLSLCNGRLEKEISVKHVF